MQKIKILVNDFGGYPFPVELSRYLAKAGHSVMHCYISNINTPHGNMKAGDADDKLVIQPVVLSTEFKKYSFTGRLKGEYEYASRVCKLIDEFKPDVFISANTPLLAQSELLSKCEKSKIKFIYWCQDIHSIALEGFLKKKIPVFGGLIAKYFENKEIQLLKKSAAVITISEDFNSIFERWNVSKDRVTTIHNWAPLNEIKLYPKENDWAVSNGLDSKFVILYSGTLGLKHNPELISKAAKALKESPDYLFLVVSEGLGADFLAQEKREHNLDNLTILPFQDYNILPKILASANVLLSILEEDAALYSVPSKVLTYLCSKRPIILSVPRNNLAARIVGSNEAGYCIDPGNDKQLVEKLTYLFENPDVQQKLGENGRQYAENNFNINTIGEKFVAVLNTL